jgi:hypothetical protein
VAFTHVLDDPPIDAGDVTTSTSPTPVPDTVPPTPTTSPNPPSTDGATGPTPDTLDTLVTVETVADPVGAGGGATESVGPFVPSGDIRLPETGATDRELVVGATVTLLVGLALLCVRALGEWNRKDDLL